MRKVLSKGTEWTHVVNDGRHQRNIDWCLSIVCRVTEVLCRICASARILQRILRMMVQLTFSEGIWLFSARVLSMASESLSQLRSRHARCLRKFGDIGEGLHQAFGDVEVTCAMMRISTIPSNSFQRTDVQCAFNS